MSICLYCRQENRKFTSVEHVIPESLGNRGLHGSREIVLPKGVVCDKCNNGKLSTLDQALINFTPIALMRTFHGVTSKSGKLPRAKLGNASISMTAPGNVLFESNSNKTFRRTPGGFDLSVRSNRTMEANYCRTLARALFKMTLGCVYIDHGSAIAMTERFDPIREMILGRITFHGYLMILKGATHPSSQGCGLTHGFWESEEGEKTVWVEFRYFGITLLTDLEIRSPRHPKLIPEDQIAVLYF